MKKSNSIMGGLVWKFGERLLSQGISFIISLVLARVLMPEDYGMVSLVLVFTNLAAVFINSGFGTALVQKKDADATDFSTMYFCSQGISIVLYLVIFLAAPWVAVFYKEPELTAVLRVFALQIPLGAYNAIQNAYVSRNMLFHKLFLASVLSTAVSGAVGIFLALAGAGVWALVAQSIGVVLTNTLVLAVTLPWHPQWKFSKAAAKPLMRYGSRILMADLSGTFFGELRGLIIGRVYTTADLAFYSKGQQLPNLLTSNLSTTVMTVIFPAMSDRSDDLQQVKAFAKQSMQILAFVIFPVMFGLAAVMEPLIHFLYTEKWGPCVPYAQCLSVGLAVGVFGIIPLQTIKAIGRSDVILKLEFLKKPVYILLLLVGVNINVLAIAVTMMLYDIYGTFVNMYQMKKYIGYGLWEQMRDVFSSLALSLVMAVAVYAIDGIGTLALTLAIKVASGVIIYVLGAIVFRLAPYRYLKNLILNRKQK